MARPRQILQCFSLMYYLRRCRLTHQGPSYWVLLHVGTSSPVRKARSLRRDAHHCPPTFRAGRSPRSSSRKVLRPVRPMASPIAWAPQSTSDDVGVFSVVVGTIALSAGVILITRLTVGVSGTK